MPYSTASPRRSVHRTRLLAALGDWRTHRLVRVVAPAGFGKSILGAQWFQQLAGLPADERPTCAWIALEATDNAPERLLARLTDALHFDFPESPEIISRWLTAELPPARILADLLKLLAAHPAPVVLLFDDVHRLRDAEPLALLQSILDDGPPNVRLALFSRTRPPLQTSRLSLDQSILTLSAHELSFDHDEFAAFVADSPLASLEADRLTSLERRAGGWPAGLQMLRQASRHSELLTIEISDRLVAEDFWEYIEREVLQTLPLRELDFLLDVSLLPFLTADLCAAVTGLSPSECELLLRSVAAINGLVTAPGGDARVGRVHAVLRDFLLRRLMRHRTWDQLRVMRRRAALHLADAGEIDAALDMLLPPPDSGGDPSLHWLGDDVDAAADVVERAGHAALQHGELVAVRRWMRKLPESVLRARPRLAVDSVWASVHLIETGSDHYLQRVYAAMRAAPERTDDAMRAEVVAMEASRRMIDGRYAEAWDALQRARTMPIPPDSLAAAYLEMCSGYLMYGPRRSLAERVHELQKSGALFTRIGYLRGRIEAICVEMSLHRIYADGAGLNASAARARQFMDEIGVDAGSYRIVLDREIGDGLYAVDQIDAARAEFHEMLRLLERDKPPAETPYVARVRLQLCDLADDAPLDIDDAADDAEWDALRRAGYGLTVLNTAHRRIQRDIRRSRPELCWRTVESLGVLPPDLTPSTPLPHTLAVLAGAVASGRYFDILGARLVQFRDHMDAIGHHFFKLHAHALLVHLLVAQRRSKDAAAELRTLLADLEPGGFIRIVLDLPAIHPLLREIKTPFAARLYALAQGRSSASSVISPAERRVLEQFSVGGSTAQIAERLFLSAETVRTHIKNIYAKLEVRDRARALDRAREMGLM